MFLRAKIVLAKLSINSDSIAPFGSEEKRPFEGIAPRHRDICESTPEHQAVKIFSNDFGGNEKAESDLRMPGMATPG